MTRNLRLLYACEFHELEIQVCMMPNTSCIVQPKKSLPSCSGRGWI